MVGEVDAAFMVHKSEVTSRFSSYDIRALNWKCRNKKASRISWTFGDAFVSSKMLLSDLCE